MHTFKMVLILCIGFYVLVHCSVQSCQDPQYIIPSTLTNTFDESLMRSRSKSALESLLQNPNFENSKNYIISIAPYSIPLFSMAAITFIIFLVSIIQIICFNTCKKQCCGNQINSNTYGVCCFKIMVFTFFIAASAVVLICIAALVTNVDLSKAINYTQCNAENIIYQAYNGNNNGTIPWSGVNNFQSNVSAFSLSIQNDIPFLALYFSNSKYSSYISQPSTYQNIIDDFQSDFLFVYSCTAINDGVSCPFLNLSNCTSSPDYYPTFSKQFCNDSQQDSPYNLILNQITNNEQQWKNSAMQLSSLLQDATGTNQQQINRLSQSIIDFTTYIVSYENSIDEGMTYGKSIVNSIQIALYVFYSLICLVSLFSIIVLGMIYCCKRFKCLYSIYVSWGMFFLLSFSLFITSGFFLTSSFFTFDTCSAYTFYFKNQSNFKQLSFSNAQLDQIFQSCFFKNSTSMFSAFNDTAILDKFATFYGNYSTAVPPQQFSTVATDIYNTLYSYLSDPSTVTIEDDNSIILPASQQPKQALDDLNNLIDKTTCPYNYYFTFNITNCNNFIIYQVNNATNNTSCIVLSLPDIYYVSQDILEKLNVLQCNQVGNDVNQSIYALLNYSTNISTIVGKLADMSYPSDLYLQKYQNAFYTYYSNVLNFYNEAIQQNFNNFFLPYNTLSNGSSCSFITTSMNSIVNIACTKAFPLINITSSLNIACSILVFLLFILMYFLTTRLKFYQYLNGDFQNFGKDKPRKSNQSTNHSNAIELKSIDRNSQLLQSYSNRYKIN